MGKKLVAARDLREGHVLTAADIAIKSPGDGLPPYYLDQILGQTLTRDLRADETITLEVVRPAGVSLRPGRGRRVSGRFGLEGRVAVVTGALGNLGPVWAEATSRGRSHRRRSRPAVGDAERGVRQAAGDVRSSRGSRSSPRA